MTGPDYIGDIGIVLVFFLDAMEQIVGGDKRQVDKKK